MAQKLTLQEYNHWHLDHFGEDLDSERLRARYKANITLAQAGIASHQFTREASNLLEELARKNVFAYSAVETPSLTFQAKPYESVVDKTYRLNCNWNSYFPQRPRNGWTTTANWFGAIDDLIRTSLTCRYIDGPELVSKTLDNFARSLELTTHYLPRATDDGYYAFHLYTRIPVDLILGATEDVSPVNISVEIQLTTQL